MADLMTFPNTWEEYERSYGFTDTEEIYTNGARIIPSFRVEQWLEHIAQPDLSSYSDKLWRAAYERGKAEAQQWIPCSERLPRIEENPVLVSWMGLVNIGWYNPIDGWITGTRFDVDEVDAWMQLPEPYKGGEQDGQT